MLKELLIVLFLYLAIWIGSLKINLNSDGILGLPLYFEINTIYLPLGFILYLVVKYLHGK